LNWLQPAISGVMGTVTVTVNPSFLPGGTDTGIVTVFTVFGSVNLSVILTVGSGNSALSVAPTAPFFYAPFGSGTSSQNVSVTFNGSPVTITGLSVSATTGQMWLQGFVSGATGILNVSVSPGVLSTGTYTGTVFVATVAGTLSLQVILIVGNGSSLAAQGV